MKKTSVVFVHGIGGSPKVSWGKLDDLLMQDPDLAGRINPHYYRYTSHPLRQLLSVPKLRPVLDVLFKTSSLKTLGVGLNSFIEHAVRTDPDIFIVAHSMGGLIVREALTLPHCSFLSRMRGVIFYGTPHLGTDLAHLGNLVAPANTHLAELLPDSSFLVQLNERWQHLAANFDFPITNVAGGLDSIVDENSALMQGLPGNQSDHVIPEANHWTLIRPKAASDLSYQILSQALKRAGV